MAKKKKIRAPARPIACPCGLAMTYDACCGSLHDGQRIAVDAEALMRSRYTAFVLGKGEYLWTTLHSQHEARTADQANYVASVERSARAVRYRRLQVLDRRPPDQAGVAQVLFHVEAVAGKLDRSMVELSSFVREAGQWRYIVGLSRARSELSHPPHTLTIDHWDCTHHPHCVVAD